MPSVRGATPGERSSRRRRPSSPPGSSAPARLRRRAQIEKPPRGRRQTAARGGPWSQARTQDSGTASACSGACATAWPPLRATGKPVVGAGLSATKVSTTPRSDGKSQVTYNGHPLYLFVQDKKPGDTNGQGVTAFGAGWFALSTAGTRSPARRRARARAGRRTRAAEVATTPFGVPREAYVARRTLRKASGGGPGAFSRFPRAPDNEVARLVNMPRTDSPAPLPASPPLSDSQLKALAELGEERTAEVGETLFRVGDQGYPFIAIVEGEVSIRDPAGHEIVRHGTSKFLGELSLLTGQAAFLYSGRDPAPAVHRRRSRGAPHTAVRGRAPQ